MKLMISIHNVITKNPCGWLMRNYQLSLKWSLNNYTLTTVQQIFMTSLSSEPPSLFNIMYTHNQSLQLAHATYLYPDNQPKEVAGGIIAGTVVSIFLLVAVTIIIVVVLSIMQVRKIKVRAKPKGK